MRSANRAWNQGSADMAGRPPGAWWDDGMLYPVGDYQPTARGHELRDRSARRRQSSNGPSPGRISQPCGMMLPSARSISRVSVFGSIALRTYFTDPSHMAIRNPLAPGRPRVGSGCVVGPFGPSTGRLGLLNG